MMEEGFFINGAEDKKIYTHTWEDVENPKGVVQIFHGMAEHGARYGDLAQFLNKNGYIVFADDHRGHGKTAEGTDELGYIGRNGFNRIIQDEYILTGLIKKKYPGLPLIILGHSFGSFIAQAYITSFGNEIDGVILSGSALNNGFEIKLGKLIAAFQLKFFNERKKAKLLNTMGFKKYNKRIVNPKSAFSWLSRNEEEVKKYDKDPLCGKICSLNFFYYLFEGLSKLYKAEKLRRIPDKLPIFICSGEEDPVGNYGKSVRKLYSMYKDKGVERVKIKLYPGGRHESINEINREEVYTDIIEWVLGL